MMRCVDARGELVRDENHEPVVIKGVAQDVTEIRRCWAELDGNHQGIKL